mgnify:FL=1
MIQNTFFFILLAAATAAFAGLLAPFFQPLLWAITLAVLFRGLHHFLQQRLGNQRQNSTALLSLFIILVCAIAPALFLSIAVAKEGIGLYQAITAGDINLAHGIQWLQSSLPALEQLLQYGDLSLADLETKISNSAMQLSQALGAYLLSFGQDALQFTLLFFLMLYLLFFCIRDGDTLLNKLVETLPLGDHNERLLLNKFAAVSRATIKGTLVVGGIQGAIGGISFALLGIQSALFWAAVMTILSVLPAVGAALIWLPAAIYLLANEQMTAAIILILVGVFVIGMVDNVLRPILVGRDTQMPDYLILLSTLGGIAMIGISGFVLGPVIAAFFLAIWAMFSQQYNSNKG